MSVDQRRVERLFATVDAADSRRRRRRRRRLPGQDCVRRRRNRSPVVVASERRRPDKQPDDVHCRTVTCTVWTRRTSDDSARRPAVLSGRINSVAIKCSRVLSLSSLAEPSLIVWQTLHARPSPLKRRSYCCYNHFVHILVLLFPSALPRSLNPVLTIVHTFLLVPEILSLTLSLSRWYDTNFN